MTKHKPVICLFVHCFPPAKGGVEYLTAQIKQLLDNDFDVHIITGRGMSLDSYKTFDNYISSTNEPFIHRLELNQPIQRLFNKLLGKIIFKLGIFSPYYFGPVLKYTPEIEKIIAKSDLIIGTPMPTKMFYDAYLFAKKYNKKLILHPSYHDVSYYNRCPQFQQALSYATSVIYQTKQELDGLLKNYKINKNKLIQLAYNEYSSEQVKKVTLHKINPKKITLGFIGQITHRKNIGVFKDYLDKYLPYWQKQGTKLNLFLAGAKTNSSHETEKLFSKYLKNNTMKIVYDFKNSEKSKMYNQIDIFVNPSHEESLGIVNFESIFHGLSTIVHSQSAFYDFLNPVDTFTTIDNLHSSILNTINHPHNQKEILNKYNQDNYRKKLVESIDSLIK